MYNSEESVNFTIKEEDANDWEEAVTLATTSTMGNKEISEPLITMSPPPQPKSITRGKYENLNFNAVVLLDRLDEDALLPSCTVVPNTKKYVCRRPVPPRKLEGHKTLDCVKTLQQRIESTLVKCNKCKRLVQTGDDAIKAHAVSHLSSTAIYRHIQALHHQKYNIPCNVDCCDKGSQQYETNLRNMIKECFVYNCYTAHEKPSEVPKNRMQIINTHRNNSTSDVSKLSEYEKFVEENFNNTTNDDPNKEMLKSKVSCALCHELVESAYSTMNIHCFRHLTWDSNLKPYLCVLCKSKYPSYDAVKRHFKLEHDKDFFAINYKFDVESEMREMAGKCFPETVKPTLPPVCANDCNDKPQTTNMSNEVLDAHPKYGMKGNIQRKLKCLMCSNYRADDFLPMVEHFALTHPEVGELVFGVHYIYHVQKYSRNCSSVQMRSDAYKCARSDEPSRYTQKWPTAVRSRDESCDNLILKDNCNYEVQSASIANVLVDHDHAATKPRAPQLMTNTSSISSQKLSSEIIIQNKSNSYPIIVKIFQNINITQLSQKSAGVKSIESDTIRQRDSVDQCRSFVTMSNPSVPCAVYPTATATTSKKLRLAVTAQSTVLPHCEKSPSSAELMITKNIKEDDCCPAIVKEEPTDDTETCNLAALGSISVTEVQPVATVITKS